jgi:hypothetical protein
MDDANAIQLLTSLPAPSAMLLFGWMMWSRISRTLDHYEQTLDMYNAHILTTLQQIDTRTKKCPHVGDTG